MQISPELINYRLVKAQLLQDPEYQHQLKDHVLKKRNKTRRKRSLLLRTVKVPFQWTTPGQGDRLATCGQPYYIGCLNIGSHPEGKAYVKKDTKTCYNPRCPICSKKWIARESMRSTDRITGASELNGKLANHVILSPPPSTWEDFSYLDTYAKQRTKMYKVAKTYGFNGGEAIFHPFRDNGKKGPHWHLITFGNVGKISEVYGKTGWVIKYKGTRETRKQIYGTIRYELDHCGIPQTNKGRSIVSPITWFGSCSYNKLGIKKQPFEAQTCPHCKGQLAPIQWKGTGDHPGSSCSAEGDLLDPGGWDHLGIIVRGGYR